MIISNVLDKDLCIDKLLFIREHRYKTIKFLKSQYKDKRMVYPDRISCLYKYIPNNMLFCRTCRTYNYDVYEICDNHTYCYDCVDWDVCDDCTNKTLDVYDFWNGVCKMCVMFDCNVCSEGYKLS